MRATKQRTSRLYFACVAAVLLWRVAAAVSPYREGVIGSMNEDSLVIRWALGGMGVVFVAFAIWIRTRVGGSPAEWLSVALLTDGLHWGGPIAVPSDTLELALILGYFVLSDLLGVTLLLGFALFLSYPKTMKSRFVWSLFLPAVVEGLLSAAIVVSPAESGLRSSLLGVVPLFFTVSMLFGLAAVVFLLLCGVRRQRIRGAAFAAAAALVASSILSMVAYRFPGSPDLYNLGFVVVPFALGYLAWREAAETGSSLTPP